MEYLSRLAGLVGTNWPPGAERGGRSLNRQPAGGPRDGHIRGMLTAILGRDPLK